LVLDEIQNLYTETYLVTTLDLELPAKEYFEQCSWKNFGQKELAKIWSDSIKALYI